MLSIQVKQVFLRHMDRETKEIKSTCVVTLIGPPWRPTAYVELVRGSMGTSAHGLLQELIEYCKSIGATKILWERPSGKEIEINLSRT
jgi:hypothetical protein